jgi:hypothetical protein
MVIAYAFKNPRPLCLQIKLAGLYLGGIIPRMHIVPDPSLFTGRNL